MLLLAIVLAQMVDVQLHNQVAPGGKPSITIKPASAVSHVTLTLARDDGKTFSVEHGAMRAGQSAVLTFGDGKGGHAHWTGKLVAQLPDGNRQSFDLDFESATAGDLKVTYSREHLDLDAHSLEFQMSRPAASATLTVVADDGKPLGSGEASYHNDAPGTWLRINWTPSRAGNVLRLELRAVSTEGLATLVKLLPWSVNVAHEEVNFERGKSEIVPSEVPKLDGSYQKIIDAVDLARRADPSLPVKLFIAGHTDTVGTSADNRKLSLDRARAIANWYRDRGLPLAIAYAGFGEDALKVKTPDNTDEPRNRRADYIVGVEEPQVQRGVKAVWYQVK